MSFSWLAREIRDILEKFNGYDHRKIVHLLYYD